MVETVLIKSVTTKINRTMLGVSDSKCQTTGLVATVLVAGGITVIIAILKSYD